MSYKYHFKNTQKLGFCGVDISDLPPLTSWFYFSQYYSIPSIFSLIVGKQQLCILNINLPKCGKRQSWLLDSTFSATRCLRKSWLQLPTFNQVPRLGLALEGLGSPISQYELPVRNTSRQSSGSMRPDTPSPTSTEIQRGGGSTHYSSFPI